MPATKPPEINVTEQAFTAEEIRRARQAEKTDEEGDE